jgi:hypothetical protein
MRAGEIYSILDTVSLAQRYDVPLMLFVLPYALFGALTASPSLEEEAGSCASSGAGCERARKNILREIGAVAKECCPVRDLSALGASSTTPWAPLHLQAIFTGLDALQRYDVI